MLEIRNLSKVYRSKTGEEVRALDNVSISFPESGMVFILGKSGSGKSTLLNIMGGLDSYDSGEFIIKGKSSKDFAGSDFDAYRNTFIGFIFQEYNVLDDFTVGANIALALELQGKKATSEKINEILFQVDLLNYAKRKPNELSGGQKQRVAIARALVKEPQIIMADEPTGALDSNTGKQIFDSLKELSREKLVLIVSHDRDFAERYADRIIELADGRIISDVTKHEHESERLSEGIDKLSGQILRIKGGYRLTSADLQMINDYLSQNNGDVLLSGDGRVNDELRSAAGISERGTTSVFEGTDAEKDYKLKKYEKADSRFIRSKLPLKNALRMGTSGLKHKKFRLVMTVLLSLIAFTLFGFADTMAAYQKINATTESLMDSNVKNASVTLGVLRTMTYADGDVNRYYYSEGLNDADIEYLREQTGLDFVPVFTGGLSYMKEGFSVTNMMQNYASNSTVYSGRLHGLVDISAEQLANADFRVTGRLPEKAGEIAITELLYRQFQEYGFVNTQFDESIDGKNLTLDSGADAIIGKHITLNNGFVFAGGAEVGHSFEIVGVVDTQFDYDRYRDFLPSDNENQPVIEEGNALTDMVLQMEITSELNYGFHGLGFLCKEDIKALSASSSMMYENLGTYMSGWNKQLYLTISTEEGEGGSDDKEGGIQLNREINQVAGSVALSKLTVEWFDGQPRTTLAENEIVLPSSMVNGLIPSSVEKTLDAAAINQKATALYGAENWAQTDPAKNYYDRLMDAAWLDYMDELLSDAAFLADLRQIAEREGTTVTNAQEGKAYLVSRWQSGETYIPKEQYSEDLLSYYSMDMSVREDMLPFVLTLYGFDANTEVAENATYRFLDVLRNAGEENPEYQLEQYSMTGMVKSIYANHDMMQNRLWENDDFVELMLSDKNYGLSRQEWSEISDEERRNRIVNYYVEWYLGSHEGGYETNPYGTYTGKELEAMGQEQYREVAGFSMSELLSGLKFERTELDHETQNTATLGTYDFKVVGVYDSDSFHMGDLVVSDKLLSDYKTWESENLPDYGYTEVEAEHDDGIWAYALAAMGKDRDVIRTLVEMSYDETGELQFVMQNPIMDTLDTFNSFIETGSKIFLYVGIGFALFSALLLMNFIATSISYKKREIGVLRAVGARSSDVFKIFFSEALVIAAINFVLSTAAVIAAIIVTNTLMHNNGINITLLTYGPRQFILMLLISVGVALLASFLPVYNIARRKPVDAIKDR